MLQITSNTGEINTGPELVQNGSFDQLGTDQVQNGSFAEVSSTDVITDGGFSATGTELVTNGDFATDNNWNKGTGWSIANDKAICNGNQPGTTNLSPTVAPTIVSGKSYLLSLDVTLSAGTLSVFAFSQNALLFDSSTGTKTLTLYFQRGLGGNLFIQGNADFVGSIDNVSIKELGTDWTKGLGWTIGGNKANSVEALGTQLITNGDFSAGTELAIALPSWTKYETGSSYVSFVGSTATLDTAYANADVGIYQSGIFALGKSYKIVLNMSASSAFNAEVVESSGASTQQVIGEVSLTTSLQNFTFYYVGTGTFDLFIHRLDTGAGGAGSSSIINIQSVSVKELGTDWTLGTGWSIGEDKAVCDGSQTAQSDLKQLGIVPINKSYKVVFDIVVDAGSMIVAVGGSNAQPTITSTNTYTYYTKATTGDSNFYFSAGSTFEGSVTNVSVQEISTSYLQQDGVLVANKSWKFIYTVSNYSAGTVSATDFGKVISANGPVVDFVNLGATSDFSIKNIDGYFVGSVTAVSAFRVDPNNRWSVGTGWVIGDDVAIKGVGVGTLSQGVSAIATKFYRVTFTVVSFTSDPSATELNIDLGGAAAQQVTSTGAKTLYFRAINTADLRFYGGDFRGSITSVVVEQLDPNNYWVVSTGDGAGIEFNKAVFALASIGANFSQSTFTIVNGRTYRASIALLTTTTGFLELRTSKALLIGDQINTSGVKSFDFVGDGSTGFNIKTASISGNSQQFTGVSIKQLGSYSDQSIYVTVKDRQTIASERVVYLIELTSLGSLNSLYFIPSSVVASNGRFTKMNFTVVSTDATPQPTLGIISFYDSTGGRDTYPMGFYTYKIYEQTSSTNLDPTLATKQLQQGMAYVHDYLGNMKEVTPPFNEYTPTPIQYIYP